MTPYFQDNGITLYNADCLDVLRVMQPASVDLTVTSPPYDNLRKYNGFSFDFENIARELYRVTKPGGVVVWVVGDETIDGSETGTSFRQALFFKDNCGFSLHDTMIYEKAGVTFPETNRYYPGFEFMFVLSKGQPKTVHLIADRKNNWAGQKVHSHNRERDGSLKIKPCIGNITSVYGVRMNVWRIPHNKPNQRGFHPATFPELLASDHIRSWSNPGDVILDPMCGSGTVAKMARKNGSQFIGIEISRDYCQIAVERLRQNVLPMFAPETDAQPPAQKGNE